MTTTAAPGSVVQRFAQALLTLDESALTECSTPDLSWTIPGRGPISGIHSGVPAVLAVATTIREHDITIEVQQILTGRDGVTAILREFGTHAGRRLDVTVALILLVRDSRIAEMVGYISDVDAYDDYLDP